MSSKSANLALIVLAQVLALALWFSGTAAGPGMAREAPDLGAGFQAWLTGAVQAECVLSFVGLRPAAQYRADCPLHRDADSDWLYVVQPDGQVLRQGIAPWNRDRDQPLAPGARIVVPIRTSALKGRADRLNDELANFLATQPLDAKGEAR